MTSFDKMFKSLQTSLKAVQESPTVRSGISTRLFVLLRLCRFTRELFESCWASPGLVAGLALGQQFVLLVRVCLSQHAMRGSTPIPDKGVRFVMPLGLLRATRCGRIVDGLRILLSSHAQLRELRFVPFSRPLRVALSTALSVSVAGLA